jgi:hypothetical protein
MSTVSLRWPGTLVVTDGERLSTSGSTDTDAQDVLMNFGCAMGNLKPIQTRVEPSPDVWQSLNHFAHRTYAPATDQSRLTGAGSGLANDD